LPHFTGFFRVRAPFAPRFVPKFTRFPPFAPPRRRLENSYVNRFSELLQGVSASRQCDRRRRIFVLRKPFFPRNSLCMNLVYHRDFPHMELQCEILRLYHDTAMQLQ